MPGSPHLRSFVANFSSCTPLPLFHVTSLLARISAVRVSLEVLGDKYRDKFTVEAVVQNSNCDFGAAVEAAKVRPGLPCLHVLRLPARDASLLTSC